MYFDKIGFEHERVMLGIFKSQLRLMRKKKRKYASPGLLQREAEVLGFG